MADLPQQNTIVQYLSNGIEDEYVFAFYVPLDEDLQVFVTLAGATPVPESDIKELGVDYSVTHNIDPITGGFITFLPGKIPALGSSVTLNRDVQASLDVEFANGNNFNGANLDQALTRLLLLCQQNKTYALERNLSYRVNSYLSNDQPTIEANTQVQLLLPGYIWMGATGGGVAAVYLDQNPDVSTLRSELANNSPGTDGARLIGYYDSISSTPTTVQAYLASLFNSPTLNQPTINQPNIVGIIDGSSAAAGSVGQVISSVIPAASAIAVSNNVITNITSITLTPGNYNVWGNIYMHDANNEMTKVQGWISSTSVTRPDNSLVFGFDGGSTHSDLQDYTVSINPTLFNVTTNTVVYLTTSTSTRLGGGLTGMGGIYALRIH